MRSKLMVTAYRLRVYIRIGKRVKLLYADWWQGVCAVPLIKF